MRKLYVCDMEEFGSFESSKQTIAILGDRCWPQTASRTGIANNFYDVVYGISVVSA